MFKAVWEFLDSLKLTVYLILAIVAVTMLGSFVLYFNPQVFGDMDQSLLFRWLSSKGLQHLTLTWWLYLLVVLVVLLGFNTLVCTIERLPVLVRRYRDPYLNMRDIEPGGSGRELSTGGAPEPLLSGALRRHGYIVFTDGDRLFAEKNRWVPFMPYAVHIGMMVFMVAHLVSGIYGYRNPGLVIFQGDTVKSPGGDWQLRLDEVKVETRPDGSLKDYGSRLTAIKDGREIKTAWTRANMPMFVEGGAVYQRQFGYGIKGLYLRASVPSLGYDEQVYFSRDKGMTDLGDTGYSIIIERLLPDAAYDPDSGSYYNMSEEPRNPAVWVSVLHVSGRRVASGWLFARTPGMSTLPAGEVRLGFADLDVKPYSGFEVNRDPGAIPALFASLIVMFGSVVTLYFRRERVWASMDHATDTARVVCTDDEMYERLTPR